MNTYGSKQHLQEVKDYKKASKDTLKEQIQRGNVQAQSKALGEIFKRLEKKGK